MRDILYPPLLLILPISLAQPSSSLLQMNSWVITRAPPFTGSRPQRGFAGCSIAREGVEGVRAQGDFAGYSIAHKYIIGESEGAGGWRGKRKGM